MARPPRLPDAAILSLIAELRAQHAVLTGTRLRDELIRRHGSPCGVSRIYRLLRQATQPQPASPVTVPQGTGDIAELTAQLATALERARLAEYREESHQTRWAGEIHRLREEARGFHDGSHRLRIVESELLDRSRELASAYLRMADLESRLRTLEER